MGKYRGLPVIQLTVCSCQAESVQIVGQPENVKVLTGETATSVMINNVSLDVVVRGDGTAADSLDALRSMPVPTPMGTYVPLGSVANVEIVQAPQTIHRVDQSRQVSVTGSTLSGNVTGMTAEINDILDSYQFPEGYHAAISGSYTIKKYFLQIIS